MPTNIVLFNQPVNFNRKYSLPRFIISTILLLGTFVSQVSAQVQFSHLNNLNGLSQSSVQVILKDKLGFMWFGTQDGLNRYDGYKFRVYRHEFNNSNSLRRNSIVSLFEDHDGDLWVGTDNGGLSRYDRAHDNFINYIEDPSNSKKLSNKSITSIYEDKSHRLWVGTYWGLNLLNKKTGEVKRFIGDDQHPESLSNNGIMAMLEDNQGNFWIGTQNGLNLMDRHNGTFKRFMHNPADSGSIGSNNIRVITQDQQGRLWIGTNGGGLSLYDYRTKRFRTYQQNPARPDGLSNNTITGIADAGDNKLWLGTQYSLELFDISTGNCVHFRSDATNDRSLSQNSSIISLFYKDGILWVGTDEGGLNIYDRNLAFFELYRNNPFDYRSLSFNNVTGFAEAKNGNIWIATDGGALNLWDRKQHIFSRFNPDPKHSNSISTFGLISLTGSKKSDGIWIGTYESGMDYYDPQKNTFVHYLKGNAPNQLNNNAVYAIMEDSKGNVWIGTNGGGVNLLHPGIGIIDKFKTDPNNHRTVSGDYIRAFSEDRKGNIWIGTTTGLCMYDQMTHTFKRFDEGNEKVPGNIILSLYADKNDDIWIGMLGGGLCRYNQQTGQVSCYNDKDGLPDNTIKAIVDDGVGHLWLSTNNGLCRFDPSRKTFINFGIHNGLQSYQYGLGAALKLHSGELIFGGINGFNIFNPLKLPVNHNLPRVYVTGLSIFNKPVKINDRDSILKVNLLESPAIRIPYSKSVLSFDFTAINYTASAENRYAYKLEGFDDNWNFVGTERKATYTNLPPGSYTLRVIAANNDGLWNNTGNSLKVTILPPFWMTWWFRALAVGSLLLTGYQLYQYRVRFFKRHQTLLEKEVSERTEELTKSTELLQDLNEELQVQSEELQSLNEELQSLNEELQAQSDELYEKSDELLRKSEELKIQKEQEQQTRLEAEKANQAKSLFLATMSHEIRTPMNGVLGMASLLCETSLTYEQRDYAETIRMSGEALLSVINDVLDFSKIESGKMELDEHSFNIRECIEDVLSLFAPKAAELDLDLLYQIDQHIPVEIIADSNRLRQILINLLGNALKFTQRGEILLKVEMSQMAAQDKIELMFSVSDTGIGIPADKVAMLFKAFSQVDASINRKYGGSGLGLAICSRLVDLMGGCIKVESEVGKGSVFCFTLPAKVEVNAKIQHIILPTTLLAGKQILVVDDNKTNLKILQLQLQNWMALPQLAHSAAEALDLLSHCDNIDLIITDMQMPQMNGIELTLQIRQRNIEIPVILLSSIGDLQNSEHSGLFAAIVNKPVRPMQLHKLLIKQFEKQEAPDQQTHSEKLLDITLADDYPFNILIAEDNLINQKLILRILNKLGYNPKVVNNGKEAIEIFEEMDFDLILMDIQMPEMDGLQAARVIRHKDKIKQPFIIALTANALAEDKAICIQAGMNAYLSKPLDIKELVMVLKQLPKKDALSQG